MYWCCKTSSVNRTTQISPIIMSDDMEIVEDVCDEAELQNGQMKEIELDGGTKVLLLKTAGTYHAIGAKCSHFGASLVNGVLCGNHVRCPWHGACFNVQTGDIEDFPGLDSIPRFKVQTMNGKVQIRATKSELEMSKIIKPISPQQPVYSGKERVVVIGGGVAATVFCMTLRQQGFQGTIVLVSKEAHLPYDRSKLSKALNSTADQLALRDPSYYDRFSIHRRLGVEATSIDVNARTVSLGDTSTIAYDKLVLATGCVARRLTSLPGCQLVNVVTLRTVDDAQFISQHATSDVDVVIAGASFIGVEVAMSLISKAKSVTVICLGETPFQLGLGKQIGDAVKQLMTEKGIKFYCQTSIREFIGRDGKVARVILKDGTALKADLCVLGIGVSPATAFIQGSSGIRLSEHGHVVVNKRMETTQSGVYAVGDCTVFPLFMLGDRPVNIQHWQMAHQQGRVCALNIAGQETDIHSVPYFWTVIFGKSLRYCGYGAGFDDIIIHGDPAKLKFVAFYAQRGKVIAVASMNFDPVVSQAAEMFLSGRELTADEIRKNPLEWTGQLNKLCTDLHSTHL